MDAPTLYTENISCLIQTYFPVWSWPRAKWWQLSSQTVVRANSESTLPKETKHDFLTNGTLLVILISTHRVCTICNGKMEYVMTVDPTESVVMEATSGQLKVIRELLCDDLRKKKGCLYKWYIQWFPAYRSFPKYCFAVKVCFHSSLNLLMESLFWPLWNLVILYLKEREKAEAWNLSEKNPRF